MKSIKILFEKQILQQTHILVYKILAVHSESALDS